MDDQTSFFPTAADRNRRLQVLEDSGLLERARTVDAQLQEDSASRAFVFWRATPTHASALGYRLAAFDREARRATAMLAVGRREAVRPAAMSRSGFEVIDAEAGSLELILEAVGMTVQLLLSDPVQPLTSSQAGRTEWKRCSWSTVVPNWKATTSTQKIRQHVRFTCIICMHA